MPIFLCRWPNGDFSVVKAANKGYAIELLDEVGNAEDCSVTLMRDFLATFHLTDDAGFELERFGDATDYEIIERSYPLLYATRGDSPIQIQQAVAKERERLCPKNTPKRKKKNEPRTLVGGEIKAKTDMPTSLVNRIVEETARHSLKKFRGKGRPN